MLKNTPQTKVIVNGSFDLIHPGHIKLLKVARSLGSFVLVGVDTDDRIRQLKNREPVLSYAQRVNILEGLKYVDNTFPIAQDSDLIKTITNEWPDYIVKGSDYANENFFEKGVSDAIIVYVDRGNNSSTAIRERINA